MAIVRMMAAAVVLAGLTLSAQADDKKTDNKKLIVGKWESTKADDGTLPAGAIVDFAGDGKIKIVAKEDGQEMTIEGTYTVAGDTLDLTAKVDGDEKKRKLTIKKLTETELELIDNKGKSVSFKRVKGA